MVEEIEAPSSIIEEEAHESTKKLQDSCQILELQTSTIESMIFVIFV